MGDSMATFIKGQIGLAAIKSTVGEISNQFRATSEYIMASSKEFQNLRKSMQEVATLRGEANSNKFTIEEAEEPPSTI